MTREEAIRRIKAWNLDSDDREVLAVIIPELALSEDERIRKEIIEFLQSFGETDEWIAWLESRKEQKPEWSEADEVYLEDALWCVDKAEKSCKDEEDKGACWSAKRWLKSLPERFNLQPKQERKPEEDLEKEMYNKATSECDLIWNEMGYQLCYDNLIEAFVAGAEWAMKRKEDKK